MAVICLHYTECAALSMLFHVSCGFGVMKSWYVFNKSNTCTLLVKDIHNREAMHEWNQRVQGNSLDPAHLVHISPVASIIVAASNHKQLVEEGSHAMPGTSHRPVSQSLPGIAFWVVAVCLLQVVLSSATTGNVHLSLQCGACMGIHLFGVTKRDRKGRE